MLLIHFVPLCSFSPLSIMHILEQMFGEHFLIICFFFKTVMNEQKFQIINSNYSHEVSINCSLDCAIFRNQKLV